MAAEFIAQNGEVTVTFTYTAPTAKAKKAVGDAAAYLWKDETDEDGVVTNPFEDATNQEKIDVVDVYLKKVIMDAAKTYASKKAQDDARDQAVIDADTDYDLG